MGVRRLGGWGWGWGRKGGSLIDCASKLQRPHCRPRTLVSIQSQGLNRFLSLLPSAPIHAPWPPFCLSFPMRGGWLGVGWGWRVGGQVYTLRRVRSSYGVLKASDTTGSKGRCRISVTWIAVLLVRACVPCVHLLACQVGGTYAGDWGLCCCCLRVTFFERQPTFFAS